jgi:hypothetical protein
MDEATLTPYRHLARPLTANDRIGLALLQTQTGLDDCGGAIAALLAADCKLEQEAVEPGEVIRLLNTSYFPSGQHH